ncbi:unnamed protein product [Adineta steineri]|uniref:G-protein coupled receptors family 1 profile domain-containing protein n=1 Tax=Adineta steineri TaxID=433720 RepID=A0A813QHZ6_9BILA|nr:unnamed protein product [Adineta steineri]CAF3487527.1 unnamed protein product [Adineta steineri]
MNNNTTTSTSSSSCVVLSWSSSTVDARTATLYICSIAVVIHALFWIQFSLCSSVRQKGMMWIYAYLLTDLFLLFRFFLFYFQRIAEVCIPTVARVYLCYFEATSKIYTNTIQSYILLALNVCRYIQIVFNRNVYSKHIYIIIFVHLLMYTLPIVNIAFQFLVNWTQLWKQLGGTCDIRYTSIYVQVYNLILIYIIPVCLNILFLSLSIRFMNQTKSIQNQQIVNNRRKFYRKLLIQSITFYTIWFLLWSPFVISFQFINVNTVAGIATSSLNYIQVAIDPAIVAIIDVRFTKAWKAAWRKIKNYRQAKIHPPVTTVIVRKR